MSIACVITFGLYALAAHAAQSKGGSNVDSLRFYSLCFLGLAILFEASQ